ncbi:ABC transporter substrate-binding protein [Streptomyces sp. NPDC057718]|uniref:ABC transporter substrate-binding protein n=1 Tax=Streptomyces sp. NPDC057718 TaxID=3346225 RepID=UPI0036C1D911
MPLGSGSRVARLAAAALALSMCGVLTACGGGSTGTSGRSGTPVAGDTLTLAVSAAPNSLDPGLVANASTVYTMLSYDSLTYLDADGAVQPGLATSWGFVGKGNTRFDLTVRQGVTFTDGTKLDAAAVVASLDYARKALGPQALALASVTSVTATGPYTVSLKLSAPNPTLPQVLSQYYGIGQIISPKGLANPKSLSAGAASQGVGPYVYKPSASVAGDHYTYTARTGYFDKSRQRFKKVVLRVISNPQSALNALKTGQIDAVIGGDPGVASQVKSAGMRVNAFPSVWQGLALIDRGGKVAKPLADVRVRQAINYALDRDAMTKAVLGEYGAPTTQTVVKDADGYSATAARAYPYDVAKAKQLLAAAGYPNGFTLPVVSINFGGIDTMAQAIKGQLARVGINVTLKTDTDLQTYMADATSGRYPALAVGYGAQSMFLEGQGLFLPTAPLNGFRTTDAELTDLYNRAAAAPPAQQAELDRKMQEHLVDQAWFAPVAFSPVMYYSRSTLGGIKLTAGNPVPSPLDWYETR